MGRKALITGITGQTGSYLAEYLLAQGYEVHGVVRRISKPNNQNISGIMDSITLHIGDLSDGTSIRRIIAAVRPDEIYNLAGMSYVLASYHCPSVTMDINVNGLIRVLEAARELTPEARIYQAGSSEVFGKVLTVPQNEDTPFYPRSPYGVSKASAHYIAKNYRESYGMKVYNGILFNHESPRRGEEFVSRKVCKGVADIVSGRADKLILGNLDAQRDWGYAQEYAEWIYKIVQGSPDDFVIATGETHTVRDFVREAFAYVGMIDWQKYVRFDHTLTRPAEVDLLLGDASRSKNILGFEPQTKFKKLVSLMMEAEMQHKPAAIMSR